MWKGCFYRTPSWSRAVTVLQLTLLPVTCVTFNGNLVSDMKNNINHLYDITSKYNLGVYEKRWMRYIFKYLSKFPCRIIQRAVHQIRYKKCNGANVSVAFYPRPVLAFGYCHRLRLCVCPCVCVSVCVYQSLACPHDNSSVVHARITKFGWETQNTLVKMPIIFWGDRLWPTRSNVTWKSNFTSFWACPHDNFSLV